MTSASRHDSVTFTLDTRAAFLQHLIENPNNRRVSPSAKEDLIEWLTNPHKRPSSQEDFSRRNYVRKTFAWDEESRSLLAIAKKDEGKVRTVVTTDMIVDVVEMVHKVSGDSGHGGWDATWKNVSTSYYGILRSDVIFLLKQCQLCTQNPSKRPKGTAATMLHFQPTGHELGGNLNTGDMQHHNSTLDVPENNEHRGE
ncbi:hypothetical protein V490_00511 [Pseudogymnoascus sp. VKM F-3557]|nr:hypothetical protein V490_00511 [Pseudogymnoascus sp. VKM F-3557]